MFATGLTFEREPLSLTDLPTGVQMYIVLAGRLIGIGLLFWLVLSPLLGGKRETSQTAAWVRVGFRIAFILAALSYLVFLVMFLVGRTTAGSGQYRMIIVRAQNYGLFLGGAFAFLAVLLPFLADLIHCRLRRIWALARLSFKEAIRRKVLWVFLAMLLVMMFGSWFIQANPADQVRTYVQVVTLAMTILLLLVAGLLASFGIPTDMRNQTIHTIVTKPVERFEIVVGRFLGYVALFTLVLIVVSAASLLYVLRGIDPDAAYASLKARETTYGELEFEGTKDPKHGTNVGKEWNYRSWIYGPEPQQPTQFAIWRFAEVKGYTDRRKLRLEFAFDIYRTTKGNINEGVFCSFFVMTGDFDPTQKQAYDNERKKEREKRGADLDEIDDRLAEKYGCFELASKEIHNLHTYSIDLPGGLFRHAVAHPVPRPTNLAASPGEKAPLAVKVRCDSRTQYVGVAKHDLYMRPDYDFDLSEEAAAKRDRLRFIWNYFKGQAGIWFSLCLVVGMAVALSTYLSGLITFLATAALFLAGLLRDFIKGIAEGGPDFTGGPFVSGYRLAQRDLGAPLEETSALRTVTYFDDVYRWIWRVLMNTLPDVERFNFTDSVAEGFNIGSGQLGTTALMMVGYVFLCALAGFYLIKWREIASSM
jgi:hypothetical protein